MSTDLVQHSDLSQTLGLVRSTSTGWTRRHVNLHPMCSRPGMGSQCLFWPTNLQYLTKMYRWTLGQAREKFLLLVEKHFSDAAKIKTSIPCPISLQWTADQVCHYSRADRMLACRKLCPLLLGRQRFSNEWIKGMRAKTVHSETGSRSSASRRAFHPIFSCCYPCHSYRLAA